MATEQEIKRTILRVAGNPVSGPIVEFAGEWARAIVQLDEERTTKEIRVIRATEVR